MYSSVLRIEDISYTYGTGQKALKHMSLNIYKGERVAVLGSNGAGKSTLFLILNGVLTPDSGDIYFQGSKIIKRNMNHLRRNVGIVFQEADSQIIASTVLAEVSFGPMNLKLPREEVQTRVEEALRYMNISEYRNRPPHYLSGGEKKRVSIADILAMQTEVIIFDEPMSSLDPYNAMMLEEVLYKLSMDGRTIILSTHDADFAYRWADRIIVLHEGSVIADGNPLDIFQEKEAVKLAHLNCPVLLDVYNTLIESGLIPEAEHYPRTVDDFRNAIFSLKGV